MGFVVVVAVFLFTTVWMSVIGSGVVMVTIPVLMLMAVIIPLILAILIPPLSPSIILSMMVTATAIVSIIVSWGSVAVVAPVGYYIHHCSLGLGEWL